MSTTLLHRSMGIILLLLACLVCLVHSVPLEARAPKKMGKSHPLELLRFHQGTMHEHWAMFIPDGAGTTKGSVVDAHYVVPGDAPFQTRIYGPRFSDLTRYTTTVTRVPLGTVIVPASGVTPIQLMNLVQLKKMPPKQNCVDWAKLAVDALLKEGFIDAGTHKKMVDVYAQNEGQVRKATLPALLALKDGGLEPGCKGCAVV